ncbi:RHS repeat protein [Pectobacterium carotovorum]|nr:RHS repeat protein [Pectobacterium carotovorum]MCQ8234141.1 RHS repeat protein [Pectobacterium carotovorum]
MFRYDDLDRLTERHIGHEAGVQVRRWEYDGVRESPSKVVYEDGSETRFGYDVEVNLTAVTDALGQRYQFRNGTCSTEQNEEIRFHRHLLSFLIITFLILIMFIYNSS